MKVATDAMCGRGYDDALPAPATLDDAIADGVSLDTLLAQSPRAAVITALTACATASEPDAPRSTCLAQLARVDRPAAVAVGPRIVDVDADPALAVVVATLRAFPEAGALERELAQLGFPIADAAARSWTPITVEDHLARRSAFDAETGLCPNGHDLLLAQLAALAAPALDDVVFAEEPPPAPDSDLPYTLIAYADGRSYRVTARNLGDWYDVEAVLGLCNALLVARQSDTRLATLETYDQIAIVVAGPRAGLLSLARRALLPLGEPDRAEAIGKEHEDRTFEALERAGVGTTIERDVLLDPPR